MIHGIASASPRNDKRSSLSLLHSVIANPPKADEAISNPSFVLKIRAANFTLKAP